MYVTVVSRERFLAEIRAGKEIPRVRSLHTVTKDDDRAPVLLLHYELPTGAETCLVHDEVFPTKDDQTVDLTSSLLEQLRRDGLSCEIEDIRMSRDPAS